ncbi:hypothetical protein [Streptomyces sp. NPDC088766]|uniref:hypothetical protein n=1 Tax=Streptomyces sp. NPDC088766 TaxID=3365893 RepID=UPI003802ECE1
MLRQIARQGATLKAAALAHVAEQYGCTYGTAYRTGFKNSLVQVRMYRDPRPGARVREGEDRTAADGRRVPRGA